MYHFTAPWKYIRDVWINAEAQTDGGASNNNLRWWSFRSGLIPFTSISVNLTSPMSAQGIQQQHIWGLCWLSLEACWSVLHFMLRFDCLFSCSATHYQEWLTPVTPSWPVLGFVSSAVCQHLQTGPLFWSHTHCERSYGNNGSHVSLSDDGLKVISHPRLKHLGPVGVRIRPVWWPNPKLWSIGKNQSVWSCKIATMLLVVQLVNKDFSVKRESRRFGGHWKPPFRQNSSLQHHFVHKTFSRIIF